MAMLIGVVEDGDMARSLSTTSLSKGKGRRAGALLLFGQGRWPALVLTKSMGGLTDVLAARQARLQKRPVQMSE
jgi:hypothetical protein